MKFLRLILIALLGSLLFGFAVGTIIRLKLEKPVRYIGAREAIAPSITATVPFHVTRPGPDILEPRPHEQQVG
jgi:hypothetical protein